MVLWVVGSSWLMMLLIRGVYMSTVCLSVCLSGVGKGIGIEADVGYLQDELDDGET